MPMLDDDYVKVTCVNLIFGALLVGFDDIWSLIAGLICLSSAVYFIAALIAEKLNDV